MDKKMIVAGIAIFVLSIIFNGMNVINAGEKEDLKQMWYEINDYPLNAQNDDEYYFYMEDALDIMNPPQDLLDSYSSQQLAELVLKHPFLWILPSYDYEMKHMFFGFIQYSDIYCELIRRDDGIMSLLEAYRSTDVDIEMINSEPYIVYTHNAAVNAEIFGCQFINYFADTFNKDEKELADTIKKEKQDIYSNFIYDDTINYLSFKNIPGYEIYLYEVYTMVDDAVNESENMVNNSIEDEIDESQNEVKKSIENEADDSENGTDKSNEGRINEPSDNEVDRNIKDENGQNRTEYGFTPMASPITRSIESVSIKFTPGTYHKYSVYSNCLRWYANNYTTTKRNQLDASISYDGWYRIAHSSPKYNCHSYAWIWQDTSNDFWLDSPSAYINSSEVTYVGHNVIPMVGDIIVFLDKSTNAINHSGVVISTPAGETGIYVRSKFGGKALYDAPLQGVSSYYLSTLNNGSYNYDVYR